MLSIERIHTETEFAAIGPEWNALLRESSSDCVFLTHEWLRCWWKHLAGAGKLRIATVRDRGRLIGILPVALRPPTYSRMMPHVLEFLGSGVIGSDYLDVIVSPDRENEVLDALAHHLTTTGLMLQFSQLRRSHCVAARLAERLKSRNWTTSDTRINVCPYVPLHDMTWETYLAALGSSQRYNLQRRIRNLEKMEGFRFDCNTSLDVIIALHKKRWQDRGGLSE